MADATSEPTMKPQDTVIFLLGELKGEVGSLRQSVEASTSAQATINAANEKEHGEFRAKLGEHDLALAVHNERLPGRAPWWSIVSGLAGVGALITVTINLFAR